MKKAGLLLLSLSYCGMAWGGSDQNQWVVDSKSEWRSAIAHTEGLVLEDGFMRPITNEATFRSRIHRLSGAGRLKSVVFKQSPIWDNWKQIEDITPATGLRNAYVFLPVAPGDYYLLAQRTVDIEYPRPDMRPKDQRAYEIKMGMELPASEVGYHAWHSTDLKSWKHCGKISNSIWVTTAEYKDGKFYIYYDEPNDQDPHLIIDDNLKDGVVGKEMGKVFPDPSHGSDIAIFRDDDDLFHMIYEDWSPLNAKEHSWDSPLAGHTSNEDGISGFEPHEHPYAIDHRTTPIGSIETYAHKSRKEPLEYEVHEPDQDAYGDYTMIKVCTQYHLFGDYHPAGTANEKMRMCRFTTDDLYKEFQWAGEIGEGFHPDPSVGFAEGKFYIVMQRETDFVSPGPWVDGVSVRVGADVDGDNEVDAWTSWQQIKESYQQKPGYARIVDVEPAKVDVSSLPKSMGFCFEFRTEALANGVQPIMDRVELAF